MRYYVISSDNQRYGPADVATLNSWIAEGRLLPHQMLEDEASGQRMPASSVDGLNFPVQNQQAYAPGQPYQQHYARPEYGGDDGSKDMTTAWICGALSLLCCGCIGLILAIFGMNAAKRAEQKGHPSANAAKILNIVGIVVGILAIIGNIFYFVAMAGSDAMRFS